MNKSTHESNTRGGTVEAKLGSADRKEEYVVG